MTLSSTAVYQQFNGNGSVTSFSVTAFQWWEIEVVHIGTDGTETVWVEGTQYDLLDEDANPMTGGDGRKGTVVVSESPTDYTPASGEKLRVWRVTAPTQETIDLEENDAFPSSLVEYSFDREAMKAQEILQDLKRVPMISKADHVAASGAALTLPTPDAGKTLVWNDDEDGFDNADSPADSVTAAAASAAAAAASASAASTSASSASTSASNASTSATNAATSATNAATSATAAQTAETNAETAETNAEAAQAAAEAAQAAAEAASENPALTFAFDNATADADPGAGEFRLNNATLASVTTVYIDNADADGNTISAYLDSFDDVGAAAGRGQLLVKGVDTPTAFFIGAVTGSIVDGTGYRKITVTHIASGGTFTAGEEFSVLFTPAGATGAAGAGTGDVVGPASAVSGNIAVFDGTTGELIADGGISIANVLTEAEAAAAYQPLAANLTEWSGVNPSANGASLVSAADYAAMRALLDLEAGTDFLAPATITGRQVISGSGLTGGGDLSADRTLVVGAGTGIAVNADDVAVDKATAANVRAAASNKVLTSDLIESASAAVALTDAATVAVDWDTGINFTLTVTANRAIGNPTNGQPGTWRTIYVLGNSATDRTITFGNQYLGEVPTITDCDSGRAYLLMIYCHSTTHFVVSSKKALGT